MTTDSMVALLNSLIHDSQVGLRYRWSHNDTFTAAGHFIIDGLVISKCHVAPVVNDMTGLSYKENLEMGHFKYKCLLVDSTPGFNFLDAHKLSCYSRIIRGVSVNLGYTEEVSIYKI